MLGKLIKYEFIATSRMFLLMYAALILVAVLNSILLAFGFNTDILTLGSGNDNALLATIYSVIAGLAAFLYAVVTFAVVVLTAVIIAVRFYRMFGDEGYLWFTLPVTPTQHILGKMIVAIVWSLASGIVVILSIGILLLGEGWIGELYRIPDFFDMLVSYGYNPLLWFVLIAGIIFTATVAGVLMLYTAIAIGPNLTKSRLGGTVLAYILVYIATQIVATIQLVVLIVPIAAMDSSTFTVYGGSATALEFFVPSTVDQAALWIFGTFIVGYIVMSLAYYLITRHFMTRKLNLA